MNYDEPITRNAIPVPVKEVMVLFTVEEHAALKAYCKGEGRTIRGFCRQAVNNALKEAGVQLQSEEE